MLRRIAIGLVLALLVALPATAEEDIKKTVVSTPEELLTALAAAIGGEVIELWPGNYGKLNLDKKPWAQFPAEVTITSAGRAVFNGLNLRGVDNLILDGLVFDYIYKAGDVSWIAPFTVSGSSHVTIKNSIFDGDVVTGTGNPVNDGFATGYGLRAKNSLFLTLENNEIFMFSRGAVFSGVDDLVVRGNDLHDLRSDGMDFVKVNRVLIEGNFIHDFVKSESSGDHPDAIQFWTSGTNVPSTDIIIRRNLIMSLGGGWTQSIFMRNGVVDQGKAGFEMFYRNIVIEDNLIVNAHTHGITVGETDGLIVRNNTILQNRASAPDGASVYEPRIHMADASTNVLIENNIVGTTGWLPISAGPGHVVLNNLFAQRKDPAGSNYYGNLFVNGLADAAGVPDDYRGVPGGLIEQKGVGVRRRSHLPSHLRSRTQP